MKVYIAGPISGIEEHNVPAFNLAEGVLREHGYDVENPTRHGVGGDTSWVDYIRFDLHLMLECDGVALLPGYRDSRGANLEVHVALALEMPVLTVEQWVTLMPGRVS